MDLSTTYMGLKLKNPLVVSSSPITAKIETIWECADRGAGAVVLKSLFEEQIVAEIKARLSKEEMFFWYPEAMDHVSTISRGQGVKNYLRLIEKAKQHTNIPIIASINCITPNEWTYIARELENSGADGLELNIGKLASDDQDPGAKTERYIEIIEAVKTEVKLPIAVKIGPYFSNLTYTVNKLCHSGINAVVLFNRFYRPDIDINKLTLIESSALSAPEELLQSLRWIALLSNKVECDLAASTGIHDYDGVVKQLLAGANATYLCTTLLKNGIDYLQTILIGLERWMAQHNFETISEFKGLISKRHNLTPEFVRVQYMKKSTEEVALY
ncbi:MAG: dihydroorotate dehydrogenase-like protein [Gemmatimonadetes bacterium]|nr:MAG: dihydroorotate dehydrogenase-like protein [Gemmatimonadota bacterium]